MTETAITYVILLDTDTGREPVMSTIDASDVSSYLWDIEDTEAGRGIYASGQHRVFSVENWQGRTDVTEQVAADMAREALERLSSPEEADAWDFPAFCRYWVPDTIESLLGDAIAGIAARRDERASFYSHADRGTR